MNLQRVADLAKERVGAGLRRFVAPMAARRVLATLTPHAPRGWVLERVLPSRGGAPGLFICRARRSGIGGDQLIVKVGLRSSESVSLRRQAHVLGQLHADDRLDGWTGVVPHVVALSELGLRTVLVERALPGSRALEVAAAGTPDERVAILDAVAASIGELHRRTGRRIVLGPQELARWVDRRLDRIATRSLRRRPGRPGAWQLEQQLTAVRAGLHAHLAGRTVWVSAIHGDLWLGNILVERDDLTVSGILDWDRAATAEPPAHDLLHLLLTARRAAGGDAAAMLRGIVRGDGLPEDDARRVATWSGADAASDDAPFGDLPPNVLATLYWIRHVDATMDLHSRYRRDVEYLADDVLPILATAAAVMAGTTSGPIAIV